MSIKNSDLLRFKLSVSIKLMGSKQRVVVIVTKKRVLAGRRILVRGNRVKPHKIRRGIRCIPHKAKLSGSSRSVFVQGIGVGRKGDRADFGAMIGASRNVSAG